jgi:dsRNA-specific ribonuclease
MLKILAQYHPDVGEMKNSTGQIIERDAVSELLNICVQRNLPKAEFELLNASGPSHAPEFTYRCHVATMQKTASHSTKKGAKQLAAQKMLTTVQEVIKREKKLIFTKILIFFFKDANSR